MNQHARWFVQNQQVIVFEEIEDLVVLYAFRREVFAQDDHVPAAKPKTGLRTPVWLDFDVSAACDRGGAGARDSGKLGCQKSIESPPVEVLVDLEAADANVLLGQWIQWGFHNRAAQGLLSKKVRPIQGRRDPC